MTQALFYILLESTLQNHFLQSDVRHETTFELNLHLKKEQQNKNKNIYANWTCDLQVSSSF